MPALLDEPQEVGVNAIADVPVCIDLPGWLGREVASYVEAELGWHVVEANGPLVPSVLLAAEAVAGTATIVVAAGPVSAETIRNGFVAGAIDVIAWPDERARLAQLAIAPDGGAPPLPPAPVLRVGGTRGGVGTSTVALTVAATVAWSGGKALVIGDDAMLRLAGFPAWTGPGSRQLAALGPQAAAEVERVARPVVPVPGLSVLGGGGGRCNTEGWPLELVVIDEGVVARPVDLLVAAADGALADVAADQRVVVVEQGPLDRAGVRSRLGRAPSGWLPYSARVARAGVHGRVPSGLPGSWVAQLRDVLSQP